MAGQNGKEIGQTIRVKMAEFRRACEGLDEETATRAPEGRWSPRQIVSHLCGPQGTGHLPGLRAFLEQDMPLLDMKPEDPYWSGERTQMTLSELLSELDREYSRIASFVEGLSEGQLSRKAHIPMLRESPLGEYPSLAQWALGLSSYHIDFHINHLREIKQALGLQVGS
jgi:DinB superfamily